MVLVEATNSETERGNIGSLSVEETYCIVKIRFES